MAEDGIWDSWEDFADCRDIDKHVEKGLNIPNPSASDMHTGHGKKLANGATDSKIRILPRPVICEDDNARTAYVPQLKILKRPEKSTAELENNQKQSMQQPIRTLAQREAAYARARQRIMGDESGYPTDARSADSRPENNKRYSKQTKSHVNGDIKRSPRGITANGNKSYTKR